jgi:hypothetical protein
MSVMAVHQVVSWSAVAELVTEQQVPPELQVQLEALEEQLVPQVQQAVVQLA